MNAITWDGVSKVPVARASGTKTLLLLLLEATTAAASAATPAAAGEPGSTTAAHGRRWGRLRPRRQQAAADSRDAFALATPLAVRPGQFELDYVSRLKRSDAASLHLHGCVVAEEGLAGVGVFEEAEAAGEIPRRYGAPCRGKQQR
jgi:hypothetical protein